MINIQDAQKLIQDISAYVNNGSPLPPDGDPYYAAAEAIEYLRSFLASLLPPEGETRACVKCADWDASINKCARNNVVGMAGPSNPAECGPDHPHWTPAPSSEKALRMALICISESDPFYRDLRAEKQVEWIREYAKKVLLASSPVVAQNKSAPEATKHIPDLGKMVQLLCRAKNALAGQGHMPFGEQGHEPGCSLCSAAELVEQSIFYATKGKELT